MMEDIIYETEIIKLILTYSPIDVASCLEWAKHPKAGAISSFIGTTRDNFDGKNVLNLEYTSYREMAIKEMNKLCLQAIEEYSNFVKPSSCCSSSSDQVQMLENKVKKIIVVHRLGKVGIKEESILIAVSTPHRELGLKACQFLIDQIKVKVPIWKKEVLEDGDKLWK
ncbi:molybdopterin biosynthesis MoaE protein [Neoconidiobolus thromboides FSU 785]|nr:molybdopterin biosynthesis MoaE protein [Neoconidiobolus thromboides FSU 785]